MKTQAKDIVKALYNSNILNDTSIAKKFFHPEISLIWNSATDGLSLLNFDDLVQFFQEISRSYIDMRVEVSHILQEDNFVTIRYKYYVKTIENPEEELGIAHFISIWELKDDKLYKGYQISQPVTQKDDTQKSYHRVKV